MAWVYRYISWGKMGQGNTNIQFEPLPEFRRKPLEFDGRQDSVFHQFDAKGQRHMEYVKEHGHFADLPWDRLMGDYRSAYPRYFESDRTSGDFHAEAKELKSAESS